jgi:soluble lytic murein transglycosylase-like protein
MGNERGLLAPGRMGALLAAMMALSVGDAAADIYRYVDSNGVVHFTDRPSHPGYKLFLRTPPAQPVRATTVPASLPVVPRARVSSARAAAAREYNALVDEASRRWGVNPALIHAVITAESNYDPEALSRAGAMGLMQLMPGTARRFGVADPWDPEQNVNGGTRYLRELLDRFRNVKLALAAYNAGEGAVEQYGNQVPPYEETQTYVDRVMGLFFRSIERDG